MSQQLRIYLAWQRINDGRVQIRRWSPDRFANAAQNRYMFLGFESQSPQATAWLAANGKPTYPECFEASLPSEPYMVREDDGAYKAWEPKKVEQYERAWSHFAAVGRGEIDDNIGVMRTLKQHKGE